jgi:hypothetical protein
MRRFQLLSGDSSRDRGGDPEPFPQGLGHMRHAEFEHRLDLDLAASDARALDHRLAISLGQDPPDARHQPLQHRPVEPVGPAETVHHLGLDMPLLRMPRVLGERVVPHHAAVLVPPLGRSKVHAHSDSMSITPNGAQIGNPCAHVFFCRSSLPTQPESGNFNDLPNRRQPNPPEICLPTANSGLTWRIAQRRMPIPPRKGLTGTEPSADAAD